MQARITIQANQKLLLEGPNGQRTELTLSGPQDELKNQLSHLDAGLVDALLQIANRMALPGGVPYPLQEAAREKNVVQGSVVDVKGDVRIGDTLVVHYYAGGRRVPKELTQSVPTTKPEELVGRAQDIEDLHGRLFAQRQVVLVNGMGGVGKTSLAQAYVHRYYDQYAHVAWVSLISGHLPVDVVMTDGLCAALDVPTEGRETSEIFQAILLAMKRLESQPCLLVLDNADTRLDEYFDQLPRPPQWHVLVTARERLERFDCKPLALLGEDDAVALFRRHYSRTDLSESDVRALVRQVECHTLTVEVLAKTAHQQRLTMSTLQEGLRSELRTDVYVPHRGGKLPRLMAYLESIFLMGHLNEHERWTMTLFTGLPAEYHTFDTLKALLRPEACGRAEVFAETLQALADKGWLLYDDRADAYKMHRIITEMAVRLLPLDVETALPVVEAVAERLSIDQTKDNPVHKFPEIPYGRALLERIEALDFPEKARLQNNLALVLQDLGDYAGARDLLEKALRSDEQNFGPDHPTTAVSYSNLAAVLHALGDYAGARDLLEKAVRSDERNFGPDHPTTAVRYSNLGTLYFKTGHAEEGLHLIEKAYAIYRARLGEGHPNTMHIKRNLDYIRSHS